MEYLQHRNANGELVYAGTIEWDELDHLYRGEILDIPDTREYEGVSREECEEQFHTICENYTAMDISWKQANDEFARMFKSGGVKYTIWDRILFFILRVMDPILAPFYRWSYNRKCRRELAEKGYTNSNVYDVTDWFINTMISILRDYQEKNDGMPAGFQDKESFDNVLREMRTNLKIMRQYFYHSKQHEVNAATARFFELFETWLYDLWI